MHARVSGRAWLQSRIPEDSRGSRGPVLPSVPSWAAGETRHGDSRVGGGGVAWKQMSRGGAGPALALSMTGSGQCPAAEGRGPAYAHKLISSASAGPPAQSGCLHCGPQTFSCWGLRGAWWEDRRRKGEGWGRCRGERGA